jgi:hypothetical protein
MFLRSSCPFGACFNDPMSVGVGRSNPWVKD